MRAERRRGGVPHADRHRSFGVSLSVGCRLRSPVACGEGDFQLLELLRSAIVFWKLPGTWQNAG
jgi:hypothetical protein